MDVHAIPEHAIGCFERLHGLLVTVHDLRGDLAPFVTPERRRHRHPLCIAVQDSGHRPVCRAFDVKRLRQDLPWWRDGRMQRCPAGLVEWVVPVFLDDRLAYVLFAGVAAADGLEQRIAASARPAVHLAKPPPRIGIVAADLALEGLRQLAARIALWARTNGGPRPTLAYATQERRRNTIQRFIHEHYPRDITLSDLGRHLGLSPSRTGAVVKQACGSPFKCLLADARLRSAADLLRCTDAAVASIAVHCGFNDQSHFFRCFRRRYRTTPQRYRATRSVTDEQV